MFVDGAAEPAASDLIEVVRKATGHLVKLRHIRLWPLSGRGK